MTRRPPHGYHQPALYSNDLLRMERGLFVPPYTYTCLELPPTSAVPQPPVSLGQAASRCIPVHVGEDFLSHKPAPPGEDYFLSRHDDSQRDDGTFEPTRSFLDHEATFTIILIGLSVAPKCSARIKGGANRKHYPAWDKRGARALEVLLALYRDIPQSARMAASIRLVPPDSQSISISWMIHL